MHKTCITGNLSFRKCGQELKSSYRLFRLSFMSALAMASFSNMQVLHMLCGFLALPIRWINSQSILYSIFLFLSFHIYFDISVLFSLQFLKSLIWLYHLFLKVLFCSPLNNTTKYFNFQLYFGQLKLINFKQILLLDNDKLFCLK